MALVFDSFEEADAADALSRAQLTPQQRAEIFFELQKRAHPDAFEQCVARQTRHSNQTTLTLTSNHAQASAVRRAAEAVSELLQRLARTAERLTVSQRWRQFLRFIFRDWLKSRSSDPPLLASMAPANCRI